MKNQFSISIKSSCHENFNSFKPARLGGFCDSCKKEVIDFTKMSDKEIVEYFHKAAGRTCGRFNQEQLKTYSPLSTVRSGNSLLRGANIASLSIMSVLPLIQAVAQNQPSRVSSPIHQVESTDEKSSSTSEGNGIISGIVRSNGETVPFVNVVLNSGEAGTTTDINGYFEFPKLLVPGDVLSISFLGYDQEQISITPQILKLGKLDVNLIESELVIMGEVSIRETYSSKSSLWSKLKSLFS